MNKKELQAELNRLKKKKSQLIQHNESVMKKIEVVYEDINERTNRIERYINSNSISNKDISIYISQKNELIKKTQDIEDTINNFKREFEKKCEECDRDIRKIKKDIKDLKDDKKD